jgi:hypothetical protein
MAEKRREADRDRDDFARAVEQQRQQVRRLEVRAERARELYERLLDENDSSAPDALRETSRIRKDGEAAQEALEAASRRLGEWPTVPGVDAALDFYTRLRDAVTGRIDDARTVADMNAALRSVLERADLGVQKSGRLVGELWLRDTGVGLPYRLGLLGDPLGKTAPGEIRFCAAYGSEQEFTEAAGKPEIAWVRPRGGVRRSAEAATRTGRMARQ